MRAIVCTRYGPPEVLVLRDIPTPSPKPREVRIRVHATAVSSSDTYIRGLALPLVMRVMGRLVLGIRAPRRPILGMVLAGEVDAVGVGVDAFKPGDEVFGMDIHRFGTYAEEVCWPQSALLALRPRNLSYVEAAAIPYGGLLALHFLTKAGAAAGKRVLVYGASGGVGTSAVQIARHLGAEVSGVCSTANIDLVRSLGAGAVIDYTHRDFTRTGDRYDIVLDAVGRRKSRAAFTNVAAALAPNGIAISVDDGAPKLTARNLTRLRQLAETGELRPVIDRSYPLEQIADAHRYVDLGHKKGNVVISVITPR